MIQVTITRSGEHVGMIQVTITRSGEHVGLGECDRTTGEREHTTGGA